jgi:tetratricopeptide (TPR) repeat protein
LGSIAGGYYGDYDQTTAYLLEAKPYVQQIENPERSVALFLTLGNVAYEQGNWPKAEQYWQEGLAHDREHGHANINSISLRRNLGVLAMSQGRLDVANANLNDALTLARDLKATEVVSTTLTILGQVANEQGNYSRAKEQLDEAITLARDINAPEAIVQALSILGKWALGVGNLAAAGDYLQEALDISQKANMSWMVGATQIYRGELYLQMGDYPRSLEAYTAALETAVALNMPEQKASALYGLAQATLPTDVDQSIKCAEESLVIFEEIGHVVGDKVRQWLQEHRSV